jgi:hypothetical protein
VSTFCFTTVWLPKHVVSYFTRQFKLLIIFIFILHKRRMLETFRSKTRFSWAVWARKRRNHPPPQRPTHTEGRARVRMCWPLYKTARAPDVHAILVHRSAASPFAAIVTRPADMGLVSWSSSSSASFFLASFFLSLGRFGGR